MTLIENYRRFRQAKREMSKIFCRLIEATEELGVLRQKQI